MPRKVPVRGNGFNESVLSDDDEVVIRALAYVVQAHAAKIESHFETYNAGCTTMTREELKRNLRREADNVRRVAEQIERFLHDD